MYGIKNNILKAISDLGYKVDEGEISIEHPAEKQFGDLSSNIALLLAKREGENPREIALQMLEKLKVDEALTQMVERMEVAGAGFVNFYFKKEFLVNLAETINYDIEFRKRLAEFGKGATVVIDYSAPNIAKPFGIGHLRSTNIGQAIYNIYKILGCKCIGDNHLGDWGTQFGKLIVAIKKWGKKDLEKMTIEDLESLYVRFHKEAEGNESLVEEGREWFKKLEDGDEEARKIWQTCVDISIKEFDRVYELLGVKIDFNHGEAFYEKMLPEIIELLDKKGITKDSQGAVIVEFDDLPAAMVRKSNGATTYFTRDLATIKYRIEEWNPDLMIYEVGADQQLHFRQLFETAEKLGWKPKWREGLVHVAHGLIRWKGGKFSTRKGDTIHLSDVIDRAMEKAKEIAEKSQIGKEMNPKEKEKMIESVAIGAIKFSDLSSDPKKDIIFDWDQIMSLEGDSGPYLQYTYARCMSVLNKTEIREQKNIDNLPETLNPEEEFLLREFYKFEEKITDAAIKYNPSIMAQYLLLIARKYNEFYGKYRILDQKEEVFRIFLTKTCASIMSYGLKLLGIEVLDKM